MKVAGADVPTTWLISDPGIDTQVVAGGYKYPDCLVGFQMIQRQVVAGLLRVLGLLNAAKSCQVQRTPRGLVYVDQ
jgi:hypothetical protein